MTEIEEDLWRTEQFLLPCLRGHALVSWYRILQLINYFSVDRLLQKIAFYIF